MPFARPAAPSLTLLLRLLTSNSIRAACLSLHKRRFVHRLGHSPLFAQGPCLIRDGQLPRTREVCICQACCQPILSVHVILVPLQKPSELGLRAKPRETMCVCSQWRHQARISLCRKLGLKRQHWAVCLIRSPSHSTAPLAVQAKLAWLQLTSLAG